MNIAPNRDALYYPYIHVRDVNWLKATLLCFPQVRRMVPDDFYLNDSEEVNAFREISGARNEPLLIEENLETHAVIDAQFRLLQRFERNADFLMQRFNKEKTETTFGSSATFQIHRGKMFELLQFLEDLNIAWHEYEIRGDSAEDWFGLHPKLGEAIMSVMAIAIARDKGLDIVTHSNQVHTGLASLDEDAVLKNLLETHEKPLNIPREDSVLELTDEITSLVMTSFFDVTKLSPEQIGELSREGQGLQEFKSEIRSIAQAIPTIPNPRERQKHLIAAANKVIERWEKHKRSLPKYAFDAMITGLDDIKAPDLITGIVEGSIAGAVAGSVATNLLAGGAVGLGVFFVVRKAVKVWRSYKKDVSSPYQFLSRIEKSGAMPSSPQLYATHISQ